MNVMHYGTPIRVCMGHNIVPYTRTGYPIRVWANVRIWDRTSPSLIPGFNERKSQSKTFKYSQVLLKLSGTEVIEWLTRLLDSATELSALDCGFVNKAHTYPYLRMAFNKVSTKI